MPSKPTVMLFTKMALGTVGEITVSGGLTDAREIHALIVRYFGDATGEISCPHGDIDVSCGLGIGDDDGGLPLIAGQDFDGLERTIAGPNLHPGQTHRVRGRAAEDQDLAAQRPSIRYRQCARIERDSGRLHVQREADGFVCWETASA